jgi:hypothetical protein
MLRQEIRRGLRTLLAVSWLRSSCRAVTSFNIGGWGRNGDGIEGI